MVNKRKLSSFWEEVAQELGLESEYSHPKIFYECLVWLERFGKLPPEPEVDKAAWRQEVKKALKELIRMGFLPADKQFLEALFRKSWPRP